MEQTLNLYIPGFTEKMAEKEGNLEIIIMLKLTWMKLYGEACDQSIWSKFANFWLNQT